MRVLQVNNYHGTVGGSDTVFFNTSEMLVQAGHEVVKFAAKSEGDIPSREVKYFPAAMRTDLARPRDFLRYVYNREARHKIAALLEAEGPFDIAHLHIFYGQLTSSILPELQRRGIPVVQTLHEYKLVCPVYTMTRDGRPCEACVQGSTMNALRHRCKGGSWIKSMAALVEYWASRALKDVRLIDRFICVSDFQLDLMRRGGLPEHKLVRLHNFVDPASFSPVTTHARGDYLLYVGRIEALKGVETLVRAVKAAGRKLLIAGTGSWESGLTRHISNAPGIKHLGFVSGQPLKDFIARARAVVVPSEWYENCPMSVLEAKAAGTPVIGADIGGIPELVRDGEDGFLFESGNVEALVGAFDRLDAADHNALARAARADIENRFTPEAHQVQLLDIYDSVRG